MQKSAVEIAQDAIVAFLEKEFCPRPVYRVQAFDGLFTTEDIRTHVQNTPSIFVTWLGSRAGRAEEKIHTWSILLFMRVNNSKQTDAERVLANHLLEYIEHKMHRHHLGNEYGEFTVMEHIKTENLWHSLPKGSGFTMYSLTFECGMYPVIEEDYPDFLTYFEEVAEGDTTLLEILAKPNEPLNE